MSCSNLFEGVSLCIHNDFHWYGIYRIELVDVQMKKRYIIGCLNKKVGREGEGEVAEKIYVYTAGIGLS